MSRYSKKMTGILDAIFEGYSLDDSGKLVVTNEAAAKNASEKLHDMVLEKARDLWDQLEAAEDSLSSVAEEIRFEELNTDPSGTSGVVTHAAVAPEDADAADAAPADLEAATALESAESISDLLSADDLDLNGIFENLDHLDNHQNTGAPAGPDMPFDEMSGDMRMMDSEDDVQDGDEDYDALQIGMGDEGDMGDDAAAMDGGDEFGAEDDLEGDMGDPDMNGDDEFGGDMNGGMDDEMNGDDMGGFDFDLDLDDPMGDEEDMDEMGGMMHDKSMRMEGKGDKPDFLDKDGDGDKDESWKKAEKDKDDDDDDDDDDKKDD